MLAMARAEDPIAEQRQVNDRIRSMALHHERAGQGGHRDGQSADQTRGGPTPLPTERQPQGKPRHTHPEQDRTRRVEASLPSPNLPGEKAVGCGERDQPDRHVHVEDPAPAQVLRDQATQCRPDAGAERNGECAEAESAATLTRGNGAGKHRGAGGKQERGAASLEQSRQDQELHRRRRAAEDRGQGKQPKPHHPDPRAPDHVRQPANSQQQSSSNHEVADNDPLDSTAQRRCERPCNGGQADVDDGGIERRHEEPGPYQGNDRSRVSDASAGEVFPRRDHPEVRLGSWLGVCLRSCGHWCACLHLPVLRPCCLITEARTCGIGGGESIPRMGEHRGASLPTRGDPPWALRLSTIAAHGAGAGFPNRVHPVVDVWRSSRQAPSAALRHQPLSRSQTKVIA